MASDGEAEFGRVRASCEGHRLLHSDLLREPALPGLGLRCLRSRGAAIDGVVPATPYDPAKPLSGIAKALAGGETSEKPFGEWNALEIEVRGDTLVTTLNGVVRNRVRGLAVRQGAIALQSEGGAVEFRNLKVVEARD